MIGSLNWLVKPVEGIFRSEYFSDPPFESLVNNRNTANPITTIARIPMTSAPTPPTESVIDSRTPPAGFAFTSISIEVESNSPSSSVTVRVTVHFPDGKSLMVNSAP